jgi:hypothetical protein
LKRLITGVCLVAAAGLLAITATACGSKNATSESSASQASIDELAARVQQNQMLNAVITISALPEHEMDTTAQGGKIDNKYVPTARMLVRVTALTDWTPELTAPEQKLHDDSVKLLQALDDGKDIGVIKPLSQAVHEDWHVFTDKAWDVVSKSLPSNAGGPRPTAGPSSSGNSTPQDNMTPAGGGMTMPAGGAAQ